VHTPPWTWLLVGLLPLLWWTTTRRERVAAATLTALAVCAVVPSYGDTVWSPYQKLVGYELPSDVPAEPRDGAGRPTYLVQISGVFYQVAVDLSPEAVARSGHNPYPHYDRAWSGLPAPERVDARQDSLFLDISSALNLCRLLSAIDSRRLQLFIVLGVITLGSEFARVCCWPVLIELRRSGLRRAFARPHGFVISEFVILRHVLNRRRSL